MKHKHFTITTVKGMAHGCGMTGYSRPTVDQTITCECGWKSKVVNDGYEPKKQAELEHIALMHALGITLLFKERSK
jgi:hypothetical protein